ncbi:MAG: pyridoxal phosphate-dependent aminotransferase [bacterium]
MLNSIYQLTEALKHEADFIDLTEGNFVNNGFQFPSQKLSPVINKYFNQRTYLPDAKGLLPARQAITKWYQAQKLNFTPEQIFLFASSSEIYNLLFATFTAPGDEILLPCPGYPLFEYFVKLNKLKPIYYQLDPDHHWEIDLANIQQTINPKTKFLVLISPNNPTGQIIASEKLKIITQLCAENHIKIISDEVFSEFNYTGKLLPRPAQINSDATIFTINGISKMFALPDLKLSWLIVSGVDKNELIEELDTINDMFLNANYLSQSLLPEIFNQGKVFQQKMIQEFQLRATQINSLLTNTPELWEFAPIQGGIHLLLKIKSSKLQEQDLVLALLREKHLLTHPGYFYEINSPDPYLMISLVSPLEKLKEGIARIRSLLLAPNF